MRCLPLTPLQCMIYCGYREIADFSLSQRCQPLHKIGSCYIIDLEAAEYRNCNFWGNYLWGLSSSGNPKLIVKRLFRVTTASFKYTEKWWSHCDLSSPSPLVSHSLPDRICCLILKLYVLTFYHNDTHQDEMSMVSQSPAHCWCGVSSIAFGGVGEWGLSGGKNLSMRSWPNYSLEKRVAASVYRVKGSLGPVQRVNE